jgi:hypothetical protein
VVTVGAEHTQSAVTGVDELAGGTHDSGEDVGQIEVRRDRHHGVEQGRQTLLGSIRCLRTIAKLLKQAVQVQGRGGRQPGGRRCFCAGIDLHPRILGRVLSIGVPIGVVACEHAVCRSVATAGRQVRFVGTRNGQDVAAGVLLAVLAHTHEGVGRVASNNQDRGAATAFDQHRSRLSLHRLERARDTALPMQGTKRNAEHRHIHLGPVLRAQAGGQHLDEAHTGCPVDGLADGRTGDKCRHTIVHQTGHHVTGVLT